MVEENEILEEQKQEESSLKETIQLIKESATEEDPKPSGQLNLRTILGGDLLTTEVVRSQIWLFVLIVVFSIVYVAFRYQCQQDMIAIDKLEKTALEADVWDRWDEHFRPFLLVGALLVFAAVSLSMASARRMA